MKVKKAVIPVAGFGTRFLPYTKAMPKEMLPIIDKPTIQYIVEEAIAAGIEEILFVTSAHSNKRSIEDHFDKSHSLEQLLEMKGKIKELNEVKAIAHTGTMFYTRQKEAKGLGHAILCAKEFVGNEPFAVLLGDDIVVNDPPAIGQLKDAYDKTKKSIMGVQEVDESDVSKYGIVALKEESDFTEMTDFIEKPDFANAPSRKAVLGRYILTPTIFKYLETQSEGSGNEIQLTDAVKRLMAEETVYALNFKGKRYDIGDKIGFLDATIDFALNRDDLKDEMLKLMKSKINKD